LRAATGARGYRARSARLGGPLRAATGRELARQNTQTLDDRIGTKVHFTTFGHLEFGLESVCSCIRTRCNRKFLSWRDVD
jgi:hypothetical protein